MKFELSKKERNFFIRKGEFSLNSDSSNRDSTVYSED